MDYIPDALNVISDLYQFTDIPPINPSNAEIMCLEIGICARIVNIIQPYFENLRVENWIDKLGEACLSLIKF